MKAKISDAMKTIKSYEVIISSIGNFHSKTKFASKVIVLSKRGSVLIEPSLVQSQTDGLNSLSTELRSIAISKVITISEVQQSISGFFFLYCDRLRFRFNFVNAWDKANALCIVLLIFLHRLQRFKRLVVNCN